MLVLKFGGTSLANAERVRNAHQIVKQRGGKNPVVVCSAVSGITNKLIALSSEGSVEEIIPIHDKIISELGLPVGLLLPLYQELRAAVERLRKEQSKESLDVVQSFGERFSVRIMEAYFKSQGEQAKAYDAFDVGMLTDDRFGAANPLKEHADQIKKHLNRLDHIAIVTGYIGKTKDGRVTTLSRGGSDFTASLIGAALDAEEIQIWTDVNGMLSTDPKVVPSAKTIDSISFQEAAELATFGAKVMHPKSIQPALDKNIPVRVLNTYNPSNTGTIIVAESREKGRIKGIAARKGVTLVNVRSTRMLEADGYLARLFDIFARHRKSVDLIATSEVSVSLTVDSDEGLDRIIKDLNHIANVRAERNKAIVCVVGEGIREDVTLPGKVFSLISTKGIPVDMISVGASLINVSFVVDEAEADAAVRVLHEALI